MAKSQGLKNCKEEQYNAWRLMIIEFAEPNRKASKNHEFDSGSKDMSGSGQSQAAL
jgi:hypothetical protein